MRERTPGPFYKREVSQLKGKIMFESEIKEIIGKNQEEITKGVINSLKENLKERVVWGAEEALRTEVKSFVETHIVPALRQELIENKDALVAVFKQSAVGIATAISKEMQEKIVKNLGGYGGREALKKLLD